MPGAGMGAIVVDIDSDEPIPPPGDDVPIVVLERDAEEPLGRIAPRRAQWHGGLADGAAGGLARAFWPDREAVWWTGLTQAREALAAEPRATTAGTVTTADDWARVDASIRAAPPPNDRRSSAGQSAFVAALLPGVDAATGWLDTVAPAFEGSRVAAVVGAGLRDDEPPAPLVIHSRTTLPGRFASGLGKPFQFIAVNTGIYLELGGFDLTTAAYGDAAPVLDFIARALNAGYVLGYRDPPGLTPAGASRPERTQNAWQRWSATGALLARDARADASGWPRLLGRVLD